MKILKWLGISNTRQLVPKLANFQFMQQASKEMLLNIALYKAGISLERLDITKFYLLSGLNVIGSGGTASGLTSGLGLAYIADSNLATTSGWELIYIAPFTSNINYNTTQLYINIYNNSIKTVGTFPYDPQRYSDGWSDDVHYDRTAVVSASATAGLYNYTIGDNTTIRPPFGNATEVIDCRDTEIFASSTVTIFQGSSLSYAKNQRVFINSTVVIDAFILQNIPFDKMKIIFECNAGAQALTVRFSNFPTTVNGLTFQSRPAGINNTLITDTQTILAGTTELFQLDIELCPYITTGSLTDTKNNYYTFQKL